MNKILEINFVIDIEYWNYFDYKYPYKNISIKYDEKIVYVTTYCDHKKEIINVWPNAIITNSQVIKYPFFVYSYDDGSDITKSMSITHEKVEYGVNINNVFYSKNHLEAMFSVVSEYICNYCGKWEHETCYCMRDE